MITVLEFVTAIWLIEALYLCGIKPKLGWLLYSINALFYIALMMSKDLYCMAIVGVFLGLIGIKNYKKEKWERKRTPKCFLCNCRPNREQKIASEREWLCQCDCHRRTK